MSGNISCDIAKKLANAPEDEKLSRVNLHVTSTEGDLGLIEGWYYGSKSGCEVFVTLKGKVYRSPEYWFE